MINAKGNIQVGAKVMAGKVVLARHKVNLVRGN